MPAAKITTPRAAGWLLCAAITGFACPLAAGDWSQTSFSSNAGAEAADPYDALQDSETRLTFSTDRDYGALVVGGTFRRGNSSSYPGHHSALTAPSQSDSLSLRAGYDFGGSLGYITLGQEQPHAAVQTGGQNEGETLGFGLRVSLNRALQLTGELLHHSPSAQESSRGLAPTRISIGAAFRF